MAISVGIDLGTTFCAVAYINPQTNLPIIIQNREGKKTTPSVIQFINQKPYFGSEAESAFKAGDTNCVTSFKRSMGDLKPYCTIDGKTYTAEELSTLLLRHLKEEAEAALNETIKDAVITVPAYFTSVEREATKRAANAAGLEVKKIIDEPNATALAYGLNNWRENANILVYDLGGGTFDVTLIRMEGSGDLRTITTRGDKLLGGRDWDERIINLLQEKIADETGADTQSATMMNHFRGMTEDIKKKLTNLPTTKANVYLPDYGSATAEITRAEFEEKTKDLIDRTGALCRKVLEEAGLSVSDVTDVLLVGGSTRMPQVSEYIEKTFGKKPISHVHPDEAVALGAAIESSKKPTPGYYAVSARTNEKGEKVTDRSGSSLGSRDPVKDKVPVGGISKINIIETTAHAMGIIAINPEYTRYINDIIIPANHPRPVRIAKAFNFFTSPNAANEMDIYVLQGDKVNPLDNQIPYKYVVSGIQDISKQKGKTIIKVQYSYDNNGIIQVQARQENDRKDLPIRKEPVPEDMSKYGLPIDPAEFLQQKPLYVVLAVDVSGSMEGDPLRDAKNAMIGFVNQMDFTYTRVAIVAVSDEAKAIDDLSKNKDACIRTIKSIRCGQTGYGNSAHPFREIRRILTNLDGRLFAITLADGIWEKQRAAVDAARECNRLNIETAAIGFGTADKKFLKDISSNEANALFVSQSQLGHAFGTIAQSLGGSPSGSKIDIKATEALTWDD